MRGEYFLTRIFIPLLEELPPRARRILATMICAASTGGTTSACAENTRGVLISRGAMRNYLRVRGEYPQVWFGYPDDVELPPRARRIPNHLRKMGQELVNYLRVRGEYQ